MTTCVLSTTWLRTCRGWQRHTAQNHSIDRFSPSRIVAGVGWRGGCSLVREYCPQPGVLDIRPRFLVETNTFCLTHAPSDRWCLAPPTATTLLPLCNMYEGRPSGHHEANNANFSSLGWLNARRRGPGRIQVVWSPRIFDSDAKYPPEPHPCA